ncbi:MAG: 1-acyl-sn-glycerol-3-phosphate acyltransferase [Planctomycetes bacterium]|nr:1-acyl-sn-glycerol-3-phosphate acyltransferase [Planctomycetota bacterium]
MLRRVIRFAFYLFFRVFHGIQILGKEHLRSGGPLILAANHPSYFDPLLIGLGTDRVVRFFMLREMMDVWFIGWFARQWGAIPVSPGADNEPAVQKAIRILRRGGTIGIFPEGRRSLEAMIGGVRPGVGRLAAETGAAIVPVVLYGAFKAWPRTLLTPHPYKIVVQFLEPLVVDPAERRRRRDERAYHEEIARTVRERIVSFQRRYRLGPAPQKSTLREVPDY